MTGTEFIGKFKSKYLWGNLAAMALVVGALIVGAKFGLGIYTHHGESIAIPNIVHKKFDNATHVLDQLGLRIEVSDTGYVKTLPPGCILEQNPEPGEHVKSGHQRQPHAHADAARHHRQQLAARGHGQTVGHGL